MKPSKQREVEREDRNAVSQAIALIEILKSNKRTDDEFVRSREDRATAISLARTAMSQRDNLREALNIANTRIHEFIQRIDHLLAENRALQRDSLRDSRPRVSTWSMVDPDADEVMPIGVRENLKRCEACEP